MRPRSGSTPLTRIKKRGPHEPSHEVVLHASGVAVHREEGMNGFNLIPIPLTAFCAGAKPIASIVIGRGAEWQTKPVVMLEDEAITIAAECRKRGLTAKVERL